MSSKNVGVDVIIPSIGRASLERSLESVFRQTFQPAKVFVIDDSFAQDIDLGGDGSVVVLKTGGSKGPSFARNLGISRVQSNWVAFLDDDDQWLDAHLETLLHFAGNHNLDVAISSANINGKLRPKKLYKGDLDPLKCLYGRPSWLKTAFYIPMPGILVRKEVFASVLFDESMFEREDLWLLSEIFRNQFKISQSSSATLQVSSQSLRSIRRTRFSQDLQWAKKLEKVHFGTGLNFLLGIGLRNFFLRLWSIWVIDFALNLTKVTRKNKN
jgi:glycosyltransferase involved in cell wall biosynthesis